MKKLIVRMLMATALAASALSCYAQSIVVISHSATQLTADDVADVFLGEKQFVGGTKLLPVENVVLQEAFLSKALGMNKDKYANKWAKKGFRDGINPPATKSGDGDVADFVKKTPGAVGYVSAAPSGVNVVQKY